MFSQMLLPEPEPSDSEAEPSPDETSSEEEDTPEKPKPKRTRRAANSQQQAADRLLMPPPAPRPARAKAGRAASADGAPAHASHEPQDSVELPPAAPPRVLRWNRPPPTTAALRRDLVQHGLPEVRFSLLDIPCRR
jgi:outer membrane biosynthesis protein TonB